MPRGRVVGILVLALLALVPLAYASPPDETWHGGLYDNGDYDDVVLAALGATGTLAPRSLESLRPFPVLIEVVRPLALPLNTPLVRVLFHLRAPPAAA